MEEIRARREALARERGQSSSRGSARDNTIGTPKTPAAAAAKRNEDDKEHDEDTEEMEESKDTKDEEKTTTKTSTEDRPKINLQSATPGYRAELTRLQNKISSLEIELKKKVTECTSLQSSLDFMSKGAEQSTHDAVRMYAMGALALTEAKSGTPGTGGKGLGRTATPSSGGKGGRRSLEAEMKAEASDDSSDSDEESGSDDEDEEEGGDGEKEEAVVNQAAAAVSQALVERNNELTKQLSDLTSTNANLQHQLSEAEERISNVTLRFEQCTEKYHNEKQARNEEQTNYKADRAVLTSQVSSLERELKVLQERVSDKSTSQEHSHVTLAKLRAELTSYQRKNDELTNDKMELETTLEELVLDKEQICQEKEMVEDQLEECKIDLESVQLELEDAKAQLEEGQAAVNASMVESVGDSSVAGGESDPNNASFSSNADAQDVTRSLTLQNTRLRTALIRLREQSELERNELQRQVKAYESDSTNKEELQLELDTLKSKHASTLVEVRELKDIIDQTSALEETIETLSDKVWNLEENNAALERTVRELEEELEVQAEMEEVQTEELKMVMRDLEGRDALVGNLEEAIRM